MRKFIYQSIVEKISAEIPEVAHFALWNNQLADIQGEIPFALPAVLIEFRPIRWRHQGNGVREAAVEIALHVLTPTMTEMPGSDESLEFLDLLTDINRALHRHHKTDDYFGHDALTATESNTDNNCGEIRHDIEVFLCHAMDCAAMPGYQKRKVTVDIQT